MTEPAATGPIRLVVSDVDGTIVDRDKNVLPGTIQAAQRLEAAGISLALVSSRPPRGMEKVRDALGLSGPIAGFNGGVIRDGDKLLVEHLVPEDATRETIRFFEENGIEIWLFADDEWIIKDANGHYVPFERHTVQFDPIVVSDFSPYVARCGKIVGVSQNFEFLEKCETALAARLKGRASAHRSQKYYLDINHRSANKGAALLYLAEHYGVGLHEVAAIGDMTNDIPMLREAQLGIAMGNAPPAVAENADVQTGPNTGTGWADAIDKFILPKGA